MLIALACVLADTRLFEEGAELLSRRERVQNAKPLRRDGSAGGGALKAVGEAYQPVDEVSQV